MLYLEKRLKCLEYIVRYLDEHKILDDVKLKSIEYQHCDAEQQMLVFIYTIQIDLVEIFDINVDLGNQIFCAPKEAINLFQEVLFQYLSDLQVLPSNVKASQLFIKLCVTSLPTTVNQFQIKHISDLRRYSDYQGFLKLTGLTTGVSCLMKYTQSTKYVCPDEQCDAHYTNQYIRMHVPGASENQTIRSDFKCRLCGETLEEVKSLRTLSDQIIAEVVPVQLKTYLGKRETFKSKVLQAIPIFLRDELVNSVEIGKTYEFIGLCRTDISGDEIIITLEIPQCHIDTPIDESLIPCTIGALYKYWSISPWTFPLCMAYHFGEEIVSSTILIKLRLFLLISLVLPPGEHILHLIAIGKEIEMVKSLMTFACKFSNYFPVSVTTPLYGKISNNRYPWVPYFIEGGSLFLSSGGICPVGNVEVLKKSTKENLKTAMTSGQILMDLPHKYSDAHTQPLSFPLRCHVWAFHDPTMASTAKSLTQQCDAFYGTFTGDLSKYFLDVFSVACFIDATSSYSGEEFALPIYIEGDKDKEQVPFIEFEQYIDIARCIHTKLTVEAENLIHLYYNMSRLARISDNGISNMPSTAIHALKSLAHGLARLNLRENVMESDATWAIFLYEGQLTSRYGLSPLSVLPQPHLQQGQGEEFLIQENHLILKQFYSKLIRFCSRAMDCHEE